MILKSVPIADIVPYENNPRINDGAVEAVMESIEQCGYCAPIVVDENMVILAGHTRLKAVARLGWQEVQVAVIDGMTDDQKRKYRLLDNKTSELAVWDFGKLDQELQGLDFDGFDFGFDMLMFDEPKRKEKADLSDTVTSTYEVIVECDGEEEQERIFNKLSREGLKCRVLTL